MTSQLKLRDFMAKKYIKKHVSDNGRVLAIYRAVIAKAAGLSTDECVLRTSEAAVNFTPASGSAVDIDDIASNVENYVDQRQHQC